MRVFVAGGGGALGLPAVAALTKAGHEVTATTRSRSSKAWLEQQRARVVTPDVFDRSGLEQALKAAQPEVVVDLLTNLPKGGPRKAKDLEATNRVRTVGSRNLLEAAIAAGAHRLVAESFFSIYGTGDLGAAPLTEDAPVPVQPPDRQAAASVQAMLSKETGILEAARAGRIEGIVLRFGGFYGPGTGSDALIGELRRRKLPVVNGALGLTPWIYIEDAAAAVVAAVERGKPGAVYNVVEDEPMSLAEFLRCLASSAGAPAPSSVPAFLFGLSAPYVKLLLVDSRIVLSNQKARAELGWAPSNRSPREALAR